MRFLFFALFMLACAVTTKYDEKAFGPCFLFLVLGWVLGMWFGSAVYG